MTIRTIIRGVTPQIEPLLACPIEHLENPRNAEFTDVGLWLDSKNHFTVIYTILDSNPQHCAFEVAAHGQKARRITKQFFKGKYSGPLDVNELTEFLSKLPLAISAIDNKSQRPK